MEERWGTLSVDDHNDTEKLIQDVLLFDRLVVPVPLGALWVFAGQACR